MDDKLEEILKQYSCQVRSGKRTRGAFLLETEDGIRLLKMYSASRQRLAFEERIKETLTQKGYDLVDRTYRNKREEYFTKDAYRNPWIMRKWYPGTECDIRDVPSVLRCAAHLGKLHGWLCLGQTQEGDYLQKEGLPREMERHNRELKRVKRYIRGKKQKNEMEICLLDSFEIFYGQACLAQTMLQESAYEALWERTLREGRVRHGSYTYHNILMDGSRLITTNFDRAEIGIQIRDLYDFLRKAMEKNSWNPELGKCILEEYRRQRELETGEGVVLYAMLLYPEKYWKLVNFYYNSRKSWMSARNLEKLVKIRRQEEQRGNFLKEVKKILIQDLG